MLRSLAKRYCVAITPDAAAVVRLSALRRVVQGVEVLQCKASSPGGGIADDLSDQIASWLRADGAKHCRVDITLSDDFCRYFTLRFSAGKYDKQATARLAELRFKTLFGEPAEDWNLHCDVGRQGDGVACAVKTDVLRSIHVLQGRVGFRAASIRPALVRSMNARLIARPLEAEAKVSIGRDVIAFAVFQNGIWGPVWSQFYSGEEISQQQGRKIQQELLLRGVPIGLPKDVLIAGAQHALAPECANSRIVSKFRFRPASTVPRDSLVGVALSGAL